MEQPFLLLISKIDYHVNGYETQNSEEEEHENNEDSRGKQHLIYSENIE